MTDFNTQRTGTGTKEWSDESFNIQKGCVNGCVYCYASYNAINKWKYVKDEKEWLAPEINYKKVHKRWSRIPGVIMFPTTHDINKANIKACIIVLTNMLKAGCPENGVVLDPFHGSETTGIVSRKLERNYIGIDLNKEYIEIDNKRSYKELGMFK